MRVPGVFAAVLIVSGCIDFEPIAGPVQPEREPVRLRVDVRFADGHMGAVSSPVEVLVQLTPGRDEQGSRPVLGDTLWVDDEPVLPIDVSRHGEWTYLYEGSASEAPNLRLRFPRLGRVGSGPPEVRLHRPARLVVDTLRIAPEQDLVVPLHPPASAETSGPTEYHSWSLRIGGSTGGFQVIHSGRPPATVTVPPAMRPEPRFDGTLHVDFWHHIDWEPLAEPDLVVSVAQRIRLAWVVVVAAPPESGAPP